MSRGAASFRRNRPAASELLGALSPGVIGIETKDDIEILASALTPDARPACPCGYTLEDFRVPFSVLPWEDSATKETVPCPSCNRENLPWEWDWQHLAGFARQYLEVESGHATPAPKLLEILKAASGFDWDYVHYQL